MYTEAREKGLLPEEAGRLSTVAGIAEGALEKIGLNFLLKRFGGRVKSALVHMASEGLQEFSQSISEAAIAKVGGIREDSISKIVQNAGYEALLGSILGGGASVSMSHKNALMEAGADEKTADKILKNVSKLANEEAGEINKLITQKDLDVLSKEIDKTDTNKYINWWQNQFTEEKAIRESELGKRHVLDRLETMEKEGLERQPFKVATKPKVVKVIRKPAEAVKPAIKLKPFTESAMTEITKKQAMLDKSKSVRSELTLVAPSETDAMEAANAIKKTGRRTEVFQSKEDEGWRLKVFIDKAKLPSSLKAIADKYKFKFDGIQEGFENLPETYQFTGLKGSGAEKATFNIDVKGQTPEKLESFLKKKVETFKKKPEIRKAVELPDPIWAVVKEHKLGYKGTGLGGNSFDVPETKSTITLKVEDENKPFDLQKKLREHFTQANLPDKAAQVRVKEGKPGVGIKTLPRTEMKARKEEAKLFKEKYQQKPIGPEALEMGDKVTRSGEEFKVVEKTKGGVKLEDGGPDILVDAGDKVLVDKGKVVKVTERVGYVPPENIEIRYEEIRMGGKRGAKVSVQVAYDKTTGRKLGQLNTGVEIEKVKKQGWMPHLRLKPKPTVTKIPKPKPKIARPEAIVKPEVTEAPISFFDKNQAIRTGRLIDRTDKGAYILYNKKKIFVKNEQLKEKPEVKPTKEAKKPPVFKVGDKVEVRDRYASGHIIPDKFREGKIVEITEFQDKLTAIIKTDVGQYIEPVSKLRQVEVIKPPEPPTVKVPEVKVSVIDITNVKRVKGDKFAGVTSPNYEFDYMGKRYKVSVPPRIKNKTDAMENIAGSKVFWKELKIGKQPPTVKVPGAKHKQIVSPELLGQAKVPKGKIKVTGKVKPIVGREGVGVFKREEPGTGELFEPRVTKVPKVSELPITKIKLSSLKVGDRYIDAEKGEVYVVTKKNPDGTIDVQDGKERTLKGATPREIRGAVNGTETTFAGMQIHPKKVIVENKDKSITITNFDAINWGKVNSYMRRKGYDYKGAADARKLFKNFKNSRIDKTFPDHIEALKHATTIKKLTPEATILRSAKRELGTTGDIREAGYILTDGSLLDLSGKREGGQPGTRSFDHREIGRVTGLDPTNEYTSSTPDMQKFMSLGHIRMDYNSGSLDIIVQPTSAQIKIIRSFIQRRQGEVVIDLEKGLGELSRDKDYFTYTGDVFSEDYEKGTPAEKILSDIRKFYSGQLRQIPESMVQQFHSVGPSTRQILKGAKGAAEQLELIERPEDELRNAYEREKDVWLGKKDVRIVQIENERRRVQNEIRKATGAKKYTQKEKDFDKAIQIYIDTKREPGHIKKYWDKLSDEQKRIVELSQKLPGNIKKIADAIGKSYDQIGAESLQADIIKNVLDNYASRTWDLGRSGSEKHRKFGTTTRHAKKRKLATIIEGWAKGFNLKVEGASSNLAIHKEELVKTIEDKRFIKSLKKLKTLDGDPLLTTKHLEGYQEVIHPNFNTWKWTGKVEADKVYGRNYFIDKNGDVFEKQRLYAPADIAENMNNILGISKLSNIEFIRVVTKYNAIIKSWILQSSFFHHLAFTRSYWFGTRRKTLREWNIRKAYRDGMKAIEQENPIVMHGIKNGLTLRLKQDWNEDLLHEKTVIGKMIDKMGGESVKQKILDLRQHHADFLFGEFGAGLKAKAFLIEYKNHLKKHPDMNVDEAAKHVANLINDDFGGLHLQRLGRDPTIQHIFRVFALAPDWTESNVRTMVKAIKGGREGQLYRKFWASVLTKAMGLTVLANLIMAGYDEDDEEARGHWQRFVRNYKRAWKEGKLRYLDVDITPLYKALGGKTKKRKYFPIAGHFKDPIKFILHPFRSAQHKGSVVFRIFYELFKGVDWAQRRFTTFPELIGLDKEKGYYKTTRKGYYREGDPKWGKLKGQTVTWRPGKQGAIGYEQLPSYLLSQVKGAQPVQIQNLLAWLAGEMELFDAIGKSAGLRIATTYGDEEATKPTVKVLKKKKPVKPLKKVKR